MDTPLCTIGITCFNAQETIGGAIAGALAQDWQTVEILVADDASTDGSVQIVRSFSDRDSRVHLITRQQNGGPAASRNTILSEARGEFVVFFDDDDEARPDRVADQIRALMEYEQRTGAALVACYATGDRLYPSGYRKALPAIGSRAVVPHGDAVADYLLFFRRVPGWFYGSGTPTSALLARRSTFEAVGGFDPALRRVEDADFAIRLAQAGGHFVGTTRSLFLQHATVAADKSPEMNRDAEIAIALKQRAYLDSINRTYYALHWPKLRYWHFKRDYLRFAIEFLGIFLHNPVAALGHLLQTGPERLRHESRIKRGSG